jgi:predicted N-formylglutamate amidohydrolase
MLHMGADDFTPILADSEGPVAETVNADGRAPYCLVCEHASSVIPKSLGDLGLAPEDRLSHAAWDIGAEALARDLSLRLDAPLVLARVSRLVYDLNRPPERADAMPDRVERIEIPGNRNLPDAARRQRTAEIYDAFHAALSARLDACLLPPTLITIHSFTPEWHGTPREAEIGLLHDDDPFFARAMQAAAPSDHRVELNVPYSAADGVTHMLRRHAIARGLRNVMIEVRNDLLGDAAAVNSVAAALETMVRAASATKDAA